MSDCSVPPVGLRSTWSHHTSNRRFQEDEPDPQNSGSSGVVRKLMQYKRWRTKMASSSVSTPNNHSFIAYITFPGLFSVFYSVNSVSFNVLTSIRANVDTECRQVLHGASRFAGLYPVQGVTWTHQDSQSHMDTDATTPTRRKRKLTREPTKTYATAEA